MTNIPTSISRRSFLETSLAGLAAVSTGSLLAAADPAKNYPITAFSKAFQHLSFDETADFVAEVGWDGIECPVRKGGHVVPERVEEDLPRMVEALNKRQKRIFFITTDVRDARDPASLKVLRVASRLGIRHYRLGDRKYQPGKSVPAHLDELRPILKEIAAMNRELGMCAGFQNHSGANLIGAAVWDIYELIKDLDPKHVGAHFDIGHATIEGGYIWPVHFRLLADRASMIYVKDFRWQKNDKKWSAAWCPLGQGMISPDFFKELRKSGYTGAICQHHEYPLGRDRRELVKAMRQDLQTLREWLAV